MPSPEMLKYIWAQKRQ